ncbi:TonB family protein [Luteimonas sp. MC1828]|uniref:TonB family protein n=1 Tax=Luteimonas sp. MC1828 TaxID=2799787 RepID=UPI0018F1A930|nr:TonB family protein [Luteimonas sp. MC1828]MBJ7575987.1 TonB family protein [Luteimonas sp. MC1828]
MMIAADTLLRWLVDGSLAASAALLLVLALRHPLRRAFGARVAYGAWALVPLAIAAAALPRPAPGQGFAPALLSLHPGVLVMPSTGSTLTATGIDWPLLLASAWLIGGVFVALRFRAQQRGYVAALGHLEQTADGSWRGVGVEAPAVVGAMRPRIVLPVDFEALHAADEAALVVAHERAHLARGDTRANLLAVALRCLHWFNPFLHLAARGFRLDQELACDATVLARHPHARRRYADAMLNVQLAVPGLPVGCHWQSSQFLKERILMLKQPQPGVVRRRTGALALGVVLAGCSYAAWAVRPAAAPPPPPVPPVLAAPAVPDAPPAPPPPPDATAVDAADAPPAPPAPPGLARAPSPPALPAPPAPAAPANAPAPPVPAAAPSSAAPPAPPAPPAAPVMTAPRYPAAAVAAKQSGRVVLKLLVGTDGSVRDAVVEQSTPEGVFDAATLEAARNWRFNPEQSDGKPVEGWIRVPVDFALD